MQCPKCGTENRSDAQFCAVCSLPFAESAQVSAAPQGGAPTASDAAAGGVAGHEAYPAAPHAQGAPPAPRRDDVAEGPSSAGAMDPNDPDADPFYRARLDERRWYEAKQRRIDAAGGPEAYEARLHDELEQARRSRRMRSAIVNSIGLVVSLVPAVVALEFAIGWAHALAALPAQGVVAGAQPSGTAGLGSAFGVAVATLAAAALVGGFAARIGRKRLWGVLAAVVLAAAQAVFLLPLARAQASNPLANGIGFGIAAFVLASLLGGVAGAAYGGSSIFAE
jgi:hypothetical protein